MQSSVAKLHWQDERRRHTRVEIAVNGRLMLECRTEFTCATADVSLGGMRLLTEAQARLSERVIAYLDHFGRLEGVVLRATAGGFILRLSLSEAKRETLTDILMWLVDRSSMGLVEDRRHQRIVPHHPRTILTLPDGEAIPTTIFDVSISGASLMLLDRPPVGTRVKVGQTAGKIVRHSDRGIAVEFFRLIPVHLFDESVIL